MFSTADTDESCQQGADIGANSEVSKIPHIFTSAWQREQKRKEKETIYSTAQNQMDRVVSEITLVAYILRETDKFNHWAAYLRLSDSEIIKLDLTRGTLTPTVVMILYIADASFESPAFTHVFTTKDSPTVRQIFELISTPDPARNNERLDRYAFSEQGNGCAYWIKRLILRMEDCGYVESGSSERGWELMEWFYGEGKPVCRLVISGERKGTFYFDIDS